jgi:calreticulin
MISSMMLYSWIYLSGLVFGLVQAKVYLQASFDQPDALNAWYLSKARQDFGEWRLTSGLFYADIHNLGLQTTQDHRYYAACVPLNDEGFDNRDKTLVLQFSVKFEQHIDCGGGYVKASMCA